MDNAIQNNDSLVNLSNGDSHADTRKAAASWLYAASFEPDQKIDLLRALIEELFPNVNFELVSDIVKLRGLYSHITPEILDAFIAQSHTDGYEITAWREAVMRVLATDMLATMKTQSAPMTEDAVTRITDELGTKWRGSSKNACQWLSGLRTRMRKTMRTLTLLALYMRSYRPYLSYDDMREALSSLVLRSNDDGFFNESFPFDEFLDSNGSINVKGSFVIDTSMNFFCCITPKIDNLDDIIQKSSRNWRISRMAAIDLNLLRIGVYELIFEKIASPRSIINDIVEIAKLYSSEPSRKFVNGILQQVCSDNRIAMG